MKKNEPQELSVVQKWRLELGGQGEPTPEESAAHELWRQEIIARRKRGEDVSNWPGKENIVWIHRERGDRAFSEAPAGSDTDEQEKQ